MNKSSKVSIIVSCRNEEKYIENCLDSILKQTYPRNCFEVMVVDGMSTDKTRDVVNKYVDQYQFIRILDNPNKFTPSAFNVGIKNSKYEIILFMGAHAGYEENYVAKCVEYLNKYNVDNVGGVLMTVPSKDTIIAQTIAYSLSNTFGTGNAYFRTGSEKARLVDTVFGGCYRKEIFSKIGLFNECLHRSQDWEFNSRLRKMGGKIMLFPDIVSYYYPKSNLKDYVIHNFNDGLWAIYPLKFVRISLRFRHYFPLLFILIMFSSVAGSLFYPKLIIVAATLGSFYLLLCLLISIKIAAKEKNAIYFLTLPIIFIIRHIFYGLGSVYGIIKLIK